AGIEPADTQRKFAHLVASEVTASEVIASEAFAPELCRLLPSPPATDAWVHEIKWDGYRILTTVVKGRVRLWSRNGIEWTHKLPELVAAIGSLKLKSAQLDGEMIVERDGRDSFNALQSRLSAEVKDPILYMLFDMPHLEGRALRQLPLLQRKQRLRALLKANPHKLLRYSEHTTGHGATVFAQATRAGYEGVVSKKADSAYHGTRNGDWVKVKGRPSDEFVVVGFTEPKGSRSDLGALLLGQYRAGVLTYVGRVGTGLDDELRKTLRKTLTALRTDRPPGNIDLLAPRDRDHAIWVEAKLVIEAYFQGIGGQGLLRQPAFKTLRTDKRIEDLVDTKKEKRTRAAKPASAKNVIAEKGAAKKVVAKKVAVKKNGAKKVVAKKEVTKRVLAKKVVGERAASPSVEISHPDRVVFPELGVTKAEVATYYRGVASLLLADAANRPLSVVRCPGGAAKTCFFQKHLGQGWGEHVHGVTIEEQGGSKDYLCISDAQGLLELVQMNVLEIHPWGSKSADPERADRVIFDLDPHASIRWPQIVAAARLLRAHLKTLGLESFVRTSGGKGLHVVVPLRPAVAWPRAKEFARGIAETMVKRKPDDFVSVAGEKNRSGKIFIDWLRNAHGATSVASYSLRARATAGVAMPLGWSELARIESGDAFTIKNALRRIRTRSRDPWADIAKVAQRLPKPDR
ncbi:MAG: DNA ligase D, partial [Rudaea sp.]